MSNQPRLMTECTTDLEKISIWKGLLRDNNIPIRSFLHDIHETEGGTWEVGPSDTAQYLVIPDYQRDYNANDKFKTNLIESILVGIPIGNVKVNSDIRDGKRCLGVIDGQHRLKTIYDFYQNRFRLKSSYLTFLKSLSGMTFADLEAPFKQAFLDYSIVFQRAENSFMDTKETIDEFAKHCFIRMNENINEMSRYTLAKAKCVNPLSPWLDQKLNSCFEDPTLREIFIADERVIPDQHKFNMISALSILEAGLFKGTSSQEDLVDRYFGYVKDLPEESFDRYKNLTCKQLTDYIKFLTYYVSVTKNPHPFSNAETTSGVGIKRLTAGNLIRFTIAYRECVLAGFDLFNRTNVKAFKEAYVNVTVSSAIGDGSLKYQLLESFRRSFSATLFGEPVNVGNNSR